MKKFIYHAGHLAKCTLLDCHAHKSYAQDGEDMILRERLREVEQGFYVDVGAHHPKRFSNTYYYYRRRWQGINIDAMPGSMTLFNRVRPRDTNLEAAISDVETQLTYYMFNEPALNTFDGELARAREHSHDKYSVVKTQKITTKKLARILDEFLPQNQPIHFLSVDVEGIDINVLRSNEWGKYRPRFVLAECHVDEDLLSIERDEIYCYLRQQSYILVAKTMRTAIFEDFS